MQIGRELSRKQSIACQFLTYILTFIVGYFILEQTDNMHPLVAMLIVDLVCTFLVFMSSLIFDNSSMYDPYWSLVPIFAALWWTDSYFIQDGDFIRITLTFAVIFIWGSRLTWNFFVSWPGMRHEDWRYRYFRERFGRAYWLVSFFGIHLFPTLLVFLALMPAWAAMSSPENLSSLNVLGALVAMSAVLIQGIADNQLRAHRASNPPRGAVLDSGLWRYSRHPNYFGEVLFWWGLWLIGFSASPEAKWLIIGPLAMTALFLFSSVPWTDKKTLETRPEYAVRMKQVSGLIPWFRKN